MAAGLGKVHIKYVSYEPDRYGNERYYFRKRGQKRTRLPHINAPEFQAAYDRCLRSEPLPDEKRPPGSLGWLFCRWFASPEFSNLSPHTRRSYRNLLEALPGLDNPYARLQAKRVRIWRDDRAETPAMSKRLLKALRACFAWAMECDLATHNPAADVKFLKMKKGGFPVWTAEDCQAFENTHPTGTKARLAYALLRFTACRRQDVIILGRQHVSRGFITFTPQKRPDPTVMPKRVSLPVAPELQRELDQIPHGEMTFLLTDYGKQFTHGGFGNWFKKQCRKAGLEHLSAHGLRKARGHEIADAGGDEYSVMSVLGHSSPAEAKTYTENFKRKEAAVRADKAMRRAQENSNVSHSDKSVRHKSEKRQ